MTSVSIMLRRLRRQPGFTAAAVVTMALGVGATTAVFSVLHAVLLRPLPYPAADRLVQFRMEGRDPRGPIVFDALPVDFALGWRDARTTLADLALYNERAATLSTAAGPFRLEGIAATPNLFTIVGVAPARGRIFDPASRDLRQVVLSDATWRRHFGADTEVVGASIVLDGAPFVVTGVMPPGFGFPDPETAFWVPVLLESGGSRGMLLPAVARLADDVTVSDVETDGRRLLAESGGTARTVLSVRTMQDQLVGGVQRLLWVLLAAAAMVFVISTANVALLLLSRGASRTREFATRLALGAGRSDLARQLIGEAIVLGGLGGAAGLVLAALFLRTIVRLAPADMPRLQQAGLDGPTLALAVSLAVLSSVVFGALSGGRALAGGRLIRTGTSAAMLAATSTRPERRRLQRLSMAGLAVTMVLLVGAGLLLRSFGQLLLVDQGFDARGALALQIHVPAARYANPAARASFHERLLDRLANQPGVGAAGIAATLPNRQPGARLGFYPDGIPLFPDPMSMPVADVHTVSDGFFRAFGIPIEAGREFTRDDRPGTEPVAVISRRLAEQYFADRNPVGEWLYSPSGSRRIVGIAGDVRPAAEGRDIGATFWVPLRQDPEVFRWFGTATLIVRARDPLALAPAIRAAILDLDSEIPPFNVRPLADDVSRLVAGPRFAAVVLSIFAGVSLALAAVGVFGTIAFSVAHRTREIGVRLALGATASQIRRLVLRDGLVLVGAGLAGGLVAATWLARWLTGMLHDVTPADPIALGGVSALLATVGLLAAWLPARRATRVSALDALRDD